MFTRRLSAVVCRTGHRTLTVSNVRFGPIVVCRPARNIGYLGGAISKLVHRNSYVQALGASATYCTDGVHQPPPAPEATYEEVLDLPQHPEKLLVDVREPQELLSTGVIPTSINVPLASVAEAFSELTTPQQFEKLYGHTKPAYTDAIIVSCRSGRRSEIAAQKLIELGYNNVKNYRGSWLDWAERNGLPKE